MWEVQKRIQTWLVAKFCNKIYFLKFGNTFKISITKGGNTGKEVIVEKIDKKNGVEDEDIWNLLLNLTF